MARKDGTDPDEVLERIRDNVATYLGEDGRNPKYADVGELVVLVRALDRYLSTHGCADSGPYAWCNNHPSPDASLEPEIDEAMSRLISGGDRR